MYNRGSRTRRREKEIKNVFEEIMTENFPNLNKETNYPDIGRSRGLQQNEPKQTHTKTYHN